MANHKDYKTGAGKTLSNAEVVKRWAFISDTVHLLAGKPMLNFVKCLFASQKDSTYTTSQPRYKITRKDLQVVLDIKGTTLSDAMKFHSLVVFLKSKGGPELEFVDLEIGKTYSGGAGELKKALRAYENTWKLANPEVKRV